MTFLPVIARELQVQARQPATNRVRWIAAAAVIGIWLLLMLASGNTTAHERAKLAFVAISIVSLGGVLLAGVFQTADCLSEERREGTLGLLFLTDLRGYDVVLGKLASTSLHTFFALLAILPVLGLPLLMGGMSAGEFGRVALVLVVTLYLSLSVGLLVSSFSRDTRGAMVGTFLVLLLLAGLLPVLWGMAMVGRISGDWRFLLWPCPPFAYQQAFDLYYSMGRGAAVFWKCILTLFLLGTGCLVAACVLLPRVWQESGTCTTKAQASSGAATGSRRRVATGVREESPFQWLVQRDRKMRRTATIVFTVLLALWFVLFVGMSTRTGMVQGTSFFFALLLAYGLHLVLKCLLAVEVSRRFSEDRQSGALELLLVTPLSVKEIIGGQVTGIWRVFRWQWLALTVVNLILLIYALGEMRLDSDGAGIFMLIMLGGIVMLFLDSHALTRVGMWMALTKKRHAKAFLATLLRVMLPAWLLMVILWFLGFAGAMAIGGTGKWMLVTIICSWFLISGFIAAVQASVTSAKLEKRFRTVVSVGAMEAPPPVWNATAVNSARE